MFFMIEVVLPFYSLPPIANEMIMNCLEALVRGAVLQSCNHEFSVSCSDSSIPASSSNMIFYLHFIYYHIFCHQIHWLSG